MFPWYAFLTYAVITAATPGPNNIMSMSNAGRLGFRRALPFNLGQHAPGHTGELRRPVQGQLLPLPGSPDISGDDVVDIQRYSPLLTI